MEINKVAGMTLLVVLLAAPILLMARPASADNGHSSICYFGKIGRPLGIVVNVETELAYLLERARVASLDYNSTGRSYRSYDICVRSQQCNDPDHNH